VSDISLDALLAEVARRQRVLGQLSVLLSADTALARNPHIRTAEGQPGLGPAQP
jgi:hypothetical protein